MDSERRGAPRVQLVVSAEIIDLHSNAHLKAQTSDLSILGCFLDMLNPLREGTEIQIRLIHKGTTFTAIGAVSNSENNLGMGVRFTDIKSDQEAILKKWLSSSI
jgi:hypothetical protein